MLKMKIADLKNIIQAFRLFNYSLYATVRFIKINFFQKNIHRKDGFLFVYPRVNWQIHKSANVEILCNSYIGIPKVKASKTCSFFVMKEDSKLLIKRKCELAEGCDVQIHKHGKLLIDSFHSNVNLEISCGKCITIGDDVTAGRHVSIKDFNGHRVSYKGYPISAPVSIGNHVWLCTGCSITPGVTIGNGAVIADNANVISDIEPATFNQGNPSKKIKSNIFFSI